MKHILLILLFITSLFSNKLETKEQSVFDETISKPVQIISQDIDYFQKVEVTTENSGKTLYVNYTYHPKIVYKNQRFEVTIKALITSDYFDKLETRFLDSKNMKVLNPDSSWKEVDSNTFSNKFFFKAKNKNFVMPTFQVVLYKDREIKEVALLKPQPLDFSEVAKNDTKFSSVIAKEFKINTYKTKQYNNNELITIIDMQANDSNLEDFKIQGFEEQGISSLEDTYPTQQMLYYLVLPVHTKVIEFKYYDLEKNRLETKKVPVVLEEGLVSTQTDLNPNKSNILFYKRVLAGSLTILFIALFIWKRKYIFLIASLIMLIIFIMFAMPNKVSFLKNNSLVYILPTKNSTIFLKTNKTFSVEIVNKKDDFVKIMFDSNGKSIIGWVKENNVSKN